MGRVVTEASVEEVFANEDVSLLAVRHCGLLIMRHFPGAETMRAADGLQQTLLKRYDGRLAWMNIMAWPPSLAEFDRSVIPVGNRMFKRPDDRGLALANVLLGNTAVDGTTRTIIRMALLAARPRYPYHVGKDLEKACRWMEQTLPSEAPWALSAAQLRRVVADLI